jgi:hypothetical protein
LTSGRRGSPGDGLLVFTGFCVIGCLLSLGHKIDNDGSIDDLTGFYLYRHFFLLLHFPAPLTIAISSSVNPYNSYTNLSIASSVAAICRDNCVFSCSSRASSQFLIQVEHLRAERNHAIVAGFVKGVGEVDDASLIFGEFHGTFYVLLISATKKVLDLFSF